MLRVAQFGYIPTGPDFAQSHATGYVPKGPNFAQSYTLHKHGLILRRVAQFGYIPIGPEFCSVKVLAVNQQAELLSVRCTSSCAYKARGLSVSLQVYSLIYLVGSFHFFFSDSIHRFPLMYKDNTGSKSKKTSMSCHEGSLDLVEDKLVLGLFSKVSFFLISFDLVEDKLVLRLFSKLSSLAYFKKYLLFCFSFCPSKFFVLFIYYNFVVVCFE